MINFYEKVETIRLYDPLAHTLGAAENGIFEYSYQDVVKLAGHSCPTVAGAYLMCLEGLKTLYKNDTPLRGGVRVRIKGKLGKEVFGVIASVATLITGAAGEGGFAGLGRDYCRKGLLSFDEQLEFDMTIERVDDGSSVGVIYDPSSVKPHPDMFYLMQKVLSKNADEKELVKFGRLWQDRVLRILCDVENRKNIITVIQMKNSC